MSDWKLYVSSGVFIFVTVLKLLLPDATAQVRSEIVALIDMDLDYREMATQVGSLLTDESVQQVMELLRGEARAVMGEATPAPTLTPSPSPTVSPTAAPSPEPTLTPEPTAAPSSAVLAAVEAFRQAQAVYSDYATPDTVSYEALQIPFDFAVPVSGVTSSGFGYRMHPIENEVRFHYGTDFAVNTGTAVGAFADGEVTMTGYDAGYGNYVQLTHADGWKTLYAHCSEITVTWGQKVTKGETIALSGDSGVTTGPHLHLELLHNGYYTNPEFFF